MSASSEAQGSKLDWLLWLLVVLLIGGGVFGNYYFESEPLLWRVSGVVAVAIVALVIGLQTTAGKSFSEFFKGARVEIKKVVWPTRQETLQTTLVVVVVVALMSLILWALDTFLGFLISLLIG